MLFRSAALAPYILIKSSLSTTEKEYKNTNQKKEQNVETVIDLNAADSIQLISIKGIGPVISKRILRYRNSLGGFHSIEQLKEVYGIQDSLFNELKKKIKTNPETIRKINLNEVETDDLRLHPYFKFIIAQSIVNFRKCSKVKFFLIVHR